MTDNIIDSVIDFHDGENGSLIIEEKQDITEDFIALCRTIREIQDSASRMPDLLRYADIPNVIVHRWLKEGFDVFKERPSAVQAKLRAEGLDCFLTSSARL